MAQAFWALLIPHGLQGGALAHVPAGAQDADGDEVMAGAGTEEGWKEEYTQWWFEFLEKAGLKGVSKDVWQMVSASVRCELRWSGGGKWWEGGLESKGRGVD